MATSLTQIRTGSIGQPRPPGEAPRPQTGSLGHRSARLVAAQAKLPSPEGGSVSGSASSRKASPSAPLAQGVVRSASTQASSSAASAHSAPALSLKSDVRGRILTGAELVRTMGKTPAWDRRQFIFFGKVTQQSRYKQTLNELKAYNAQVGATKLSDDPATRRQQLTDLKAKLDDVAAKANSYIGRNHSQARKDAMSGLVGQIANEKTLLDKVMADPRASAASGLSWGEAAEFTRHGVPLSEHAQTFGIEDANLQGKPKLLGQGAFNAVFLGKYTTGTGTETRVVKQLPAEEPGRRGAVAEETGIPHDSPRYGSRNIATSLLNDKLGLNVAPKCSHAMSGGRLALAMELAPGKTAKDMLINLGTRLASHPQVQKQVNDLEWLDAIMGQGDRHWSNYMIDVSKSGAVRVTGIDNDQCAGKSLRDPDAIIRHTGGRNAGKCCAHNIGLPPLISRELAQKLAATDFDRDIAPTLPKLLDKGEIDAMRDRFTAAQGKAQQLERDGFAISDWSGWKAPASAPTGAGKDVLGYLQDHPKREARGGDIAPSYLVRDLNNAGPSYGAFA